jgi:prophage antirepressor-like protein
MTEEIKDDNNCIVKAFENNPIAILHEDINSKKIYYFKASDIGKALGIVNIRSTIQNYDDDERVVRNVYDPQGTPQDTIFLSSQGVYRLLYNSKKEIAKKFRKWAGNILDDIIFNESAELKRQLEEKEKQHQIELQENEKMLLEKETLLQESSKQHQIELQEKNKQLSDLQKLKVKKWYNQDPGDMVYAVKINSGLIKIGKTKNIKDREAHYVNNQVGNMFHIKKCFNCDLTEKVLHHILDKHRIENNKDESTRFDSFAWFNISDELVIYTIDLVCDFLDKFINVSEELPQYKIKEFLESCHKTNNVENIEIKESLLNKVVNIESNEDKIKKFVDEYCELDENNYVLSYEILGAYRLWSRGFTQTDRTQFTQFMKKHYNSRRKYYKEYNNSSLLVYLGIKPKELKVEQENKNILPKYEEFILTECKYNYTYRIRYSDFINEYTNWYTNKYPEYMFSKEEKINMEAYINRHFLKDKINMPGHKNVPGIWGVQLKSDNSFRIGANPTHRKEIVKIDCETKQIVEEYKSVIIASEKLNLETNYIRTCIKDKKIIENFMLEYKKNIDILEYM